jgi:hypothetical protein
MDLYSFEQSLAKFYTILLEGTSSSCFRDVGGGNLFLTLVFKTGDCAGKGRYLPSCSSIYEHFQLCKWGALLSLENNIVVQK